MKSLTAFRPVLDQMAGNIAWTTALGEAYYHDPDDVMNAIQVMRQRAQRAGQLKSGKQLRVAQATSAPTTYAPAPPPAYGGPVIVEGHYANPKEGPETSTVAQIAEVRVDTETGEVKVTRLTTAHNTGTILNPLTHQGQIDGAVVMGIGYGTMEALMTDESGRVMSASLGDYKIPNIKDVPQVKTAIVQSPAGSGPYNSMSIGETAIIPTAAAIANAVEDAVGVRITELPITPEKVLAALRAKKEEGAAHA